MLENLSEDDSRPPSSVYSFFVAPVIEVLTQRNVAKRSRQINMIETKLKFVDFHLSAAKKMGMPHRAEITVLSLIVKNTGSVPLSVFDDEADIFCYYRDIP